MVARFDDAPGVGRPRAAAHGLPLDGAPRSVDAPPPALGADNAEIWARWA
jgi:crotonobetainyl-CoA:carnitine CoA-transferase CaiB-like acyl-CoA transferase